MLKREFRHASGFFLSPLARTENLGKHDVSGGGVFAKRKKKKGCFLHFSRFAAATKKILSQTHTRRFPLPSLLEFAAIFRRGDASPPPFPPFIFILFSFYFSKVFGGVSAGHKSRSLGLRSGKPLRTTGMQSYLARGGREGEGRGEGVLKFEMGGGGLHFLRRKRGES